ncbi:MAG: shikimate dehydrogenase [Flavobacteriaceae bacterium]|nr:MAG: shikimate dehydrogenase [Flavobacteriaceae bacterium]
MTEKKYKYGLIGKNISYSFSRHYFTEKFKKLRLAQHTYENVDKKSTEELTSFFKNDFKNFKGFSVTIPYKHDVFNFLDEVEVEAKKIGAVNCIKVTEDYKLIGYNTDVYGFKKAIKPMLKPMHSNALILGTGGAAKAVAYVFDSLGISYKFVSRSPGDNKIAYVDITEEIMLEHLVIVNCSPVGTFPNTDVCPDIPYPFITGNHVLFDLIYNPAETLFLTKGKSNGAAIKNGLEMLEQQAEKAWDIWN